MAEKDKKKESPPVVGTQIAFAYKTVKLAITKKGNHGKT